MTATLAAPHVEPLVTTVAVLVAPPDGVRVLREVFQSLEGGFPGAILIMAHAGTGRERGIADNLNVASSVMVHPAEDGVRLRNGHAYVVRSDARLTVDLGGCLTGANGAALLTSLASRYGAGAMVVALTALDSLEKEGFVRIREAGGHTLALDESDRLWADSSGPRVVPDPADELLATTALGPRLVALAHQVLS